MSMQHQADSVSRTDWKSRLDEIIEAQSDRIVEVRQRLHAQPEPSGEEFSTTQYLAELMRELGLGGRPGSDGRGLIAERADNQEGPIIAIRADIDGLRIQDKKDVPYRSRVPGVMHACGHDGHAAVVYGTIAALHRAAAVGVLPWPVSWRAIFQPAEESNRGALEMIAAGALDRVEALLSLHLDPSRRTGCIGVRAGTFTADCVAVEVRVAGQGGHAARPYEVRDPIAAAAQFISSVYQTLPRAVGDKDQVVVSFGQIFGGDTLNAIPDTVVLRGTIRSLSPAGRQTALDTLQRVAEGVGHTSRTEIALEYDAGPPSVYNDPGLTELIRATAADLLGGEQVEYIAHPSMGGEDFANYLRHVPGTMFRLGCAASADAPPLHSPEFDLDERALTLGTKILARAVVTWSGDAHGAYAPA